MASSRPQTRRGESEVFFEVYDDQEDGSSIDEREGPDTNSQGGYRSDPEIENSDGSDDTPDEAVQDDIEKFKNTFKGIAQRFRLINRIGEGTFSTVYKAEDLLYDNYDNQWDIEQKDVSKWAPPPLKRRRMGDGPMPPTRAHSRNQKPKYVAIKKIYVTSSPIRTQNELELLHDLRGCDSVCPLITAFRYQDQVVAVLPYFKHMDFRDYFRDMTVADIRLYFRSLFTALAAVHKHNILHRDIKPTNFLYDIRKGRGVLVDFGLAEKEGTDCTPCICRDTQSERREKVLNALALTGQQPSTGYPKNDPRPSRRANRAGTRGFRAPEVLLKCTDQTTKIDIWSSGVILLTILSRRFPFFNSADDIEALIEIATIFGSRRMKACANLHGAIFETTIPTIGEKGFHLEKIILWATNRSGKNEHGEEEKLPSDEVQAVKFLQRCFELDPQKRISAEEALRHEFLAEVGEDGDYDEVKML
ncbi:hypothetical protein GP486_001283 [Trichoglossum hirsutum]|uniref:non-specific serine/threonine protein kinase n=1 Tax=Trichoglossum hirsutum TaxID=265104 RepID=A0A9P8RT65_9PEZI|nr:hypothetical protein GP486_001283 [Trichoglossum hirsutum]